MSYTSNLAKNIAMGNIFCSDDADNHLFDTLVGRNESGEGTDGLIDQLEPAQRFEDDDANTIIEELKSEKSSSESTVKMVMDDIKRGMIDMAVNGEFPDDLNELDMDAVATRGQMIRLLSPEG